MERRKFRFGVFTSSDTAAIIVEKIRKEHIRDVEIEVAYEGLEEAIPVGRAMEEDGIEVIISRRGTASLLRENLRIPIISFPLTSLDILSSIKKAGTFGNKILFPAFRRQLAGIEIIEELLHIQVFQGIYHDSKSLEQLVVQARENGCRSAAGGGVTKRYGDKHGLKVVEITTSAEEVFSTIENAKSAARSNREEQEKAQRYRQIIDNISEGIIAINRKSEITTINKAARDAFRIYDRQITGEPVTKYFPELGIIKVLETQRPILNQIKEVNGLQHVFNHLPIVMGSEVIGAVTTLKDITDHMRAENALRHSLTKRLVSRYFIENLIHKSPVMKEVVNKAGRFAVTDSTILISGETGTGKEILVQSIHNLSRRQKSPFVSINCASLPDQLIESELFGYDPGAFTGASRGGKSGLFELAHKGTIFLDEISATSPSVQSSLLRVLQEREVRRIGADRLIPIDVRVLAATNKNLVEEATRGRFRNDLYFRLNVLHIRIPPLRERREDIPLLVDYFTKSASQRYKTEPLIIPAHYVSRMMQHPWLGNVRQLISFIEQLVLLCGSIFSPDTFDSLNADCMPEPPPEDGWRGRADLAELKVRAARQNREQEAGILLKALEEADFSKSRAARALGISRTTLWRRLKNAGLS